MLIGLSLVNEIISWVSEDIKNATKSDPSPGHTYILCYKNNADVLSPVPDISLLSCKFSNT